MAHRPTQATFTLTREDWLLLGAMVKLRGVMVKPFWILLVCQGDFMRPGTLAIDFKHHFLWRADVWMGVEGLALEKGSSSLEGT